MVERMVEPLQGKDGRYQRQWLLEVRRGGGGKLMCTGYHMTRGVWCEMTLKGRGWTMTHESRPLNDEQRMVFLKEFAAYKAQYLKRKAKGSK